MPRRKSERMGVVIRSLKDDDTLRDYRYWLSRPPEERIAAMEILRLQWHKIRNERPIPLQRDEELFELFNQEKVKYLIIGAHALGFYGIPRLTGDIDVLVGAAASNARRVTSAVRRFGFNIKGIEEKDFMKPDAVMQLGYPPVRIDILTSISGVDFEEAWKRRVAGKYGRIAVWFIAKEDLLTSKRAAGRKKDILDIEILSSRAKKSSPRRHRE